MRNYLYKTVPLFAAHGACAGQLHLVSINFATRRNLSENCVQFVRIVVPCQIAQHVLAVETVYPRRLREEAALAVKDARPAVEQHVALGVDHRQAVVALAHDRVEVLRSVRMKNE